MINIFKKQKFLLLLILTVFIFVRFLGVHYPYHQDEYKWVQYSHPEIIPPGTVPHPPLTEFLYTRLGPLVGDNNFRFIPFAFSILNLFLIFCLAKTIFGKRSALWTIFFFAISFYSVLASLMVDVDGAVMPFFFLLMTIGYFKLKIEKRWFWLALMLAGAIGGFLVKMSFFLGIVVLALDFAIDKKVFSDKKKLLKYFLWAGATVVFSVLVLFAAKFIFPFFNLERAFKYWQHFAIFNGRGWLQTFIQFAKSLMYTSPLLVLPVFFAGREIWKKTRPFFFFIFIGLFFYLFAFDFSIGALDRYFEFLVIPLCLISGAVFAKFIEKLKNVNFNKDILFPLATAIVIFSFQFLPHYVPVLYPKTEWLKRVLLLKWNFLFPFMGGSGPLGFYVSFLFIVLLWICSIILVLLVLRKNNMKKTFLVWIFVLGIIYNGVFIEEYLFGKINGNSVALLKNTLSFISQNKDIQKVTTYNDIGGYELMRMGKYRKRIYIMPGSEEYHKISLTQYKEHYLVIDIPRINPQSIYQKYFNSCATIFEETSKNISAKVYDCRKAIDLK